MKKFKGRPEPVIVAMIWDDLWLVAKYQPNSEIAGSPRKVYRDRAIDKLSGVKLLDGSPRATEAHQPNSEY